MSTDLAFHLVFVFVFFAFSGIRTYYQKKAQDQGGQADFKESKQHPLTIFRKLVGIPFMLLLLAYVFSPAILDFSIIDLPPWARWLGVYLGLASLPLTVWVQWALGLNFETHLHVREEHTLVTHGPYRWVRHPMYTVLYLHLVGITLLTASWFIGAVFLGSLTLIVVTRLKNEEAAMLEKFGAEYELYMQRTGRFLPRIA